MGYQLRLTSATAGQYTFEITPSIDFELMNRIDSAGTKDGVEIVLPIHGFIRSIAGDPAETFDKWLTLYNFFINSEVLTIEIILDSAIKLKLDPLDFIGSPVIRNLSTIPQGGSLVNMIEFTMDISATKGSTKITGTTDAQRQSETHWWNDRLQRKIWRVTATGPTARSILLAMKPPLKPIGVSELRAVDTNKYQIEFTFDQVHTDKFLLWTEHVSVKEGDHPIIPVYRTDDAEPILEEGRRREIEVTVSGRRVSLDSDIAAPPLLFPTKFRDFTRSTVTPILVDDPIRGTYYREYTDIFIFQNVAQVNRQLIRSRVPVRSADYSSAIPDSTAPGFEGKV